MDGILNLFILEALNEEVQREENNLQRRILRDDSNPFEVPDETFVKYYRIPKDLTRSLIELLRPHFAEPLRQSSVPIQLKVLTTLYFLGHGSYQKCIGMNWNLNLEQSTVSKIISETTDCMVEHLMPELIKIPITPAEQNAVKQQFYEKFQFPGVIGAIDCTHIAIIAPPTEDPLRPGIAYYNRKGYYSINVQMICDANLMITNCNARFPGSVHDSAIWSLSPIRQLLEQDFIAGQNNSSWLIGDSGYPLEPWLLTPIEHADEGTPEGRYTFTHIRARNSIERCFGCLKQRFRCLLKHRVLHYNPVRAAKIIYSCVILHNFLVRHRIPVTNIDDLDNPEQNADDVPNANNIVADNQNGWFRQGNQVRRDLINNNFLL